MVLSKTFLGALSVSCLGAAFGPVLLSGQPQTAHAFEVASVKPHPLPSNNTRLKPWMPTFQCDPTRHCGLTGHRFTEFAVSLADLIVDAYKIKKFQIVGLPDWGEAGPDAYDVDARIGDETSPTPDEARLMLQTLMADRFRLRVHYEARTMPVYALVVSKRGLKLISNQPVCNNRPGAVNGRSPARQGGETGVASTGRSDFLFPWAFYAQGLSKFVDRPVIDESGLDGSGYCTADGLQPMTAIMLDTGAGGSIYTSIEDKWGIKLEPRRAEINVLVIDRVEKPSPN